MPEQKTHIPEWPGHAPADYAGGPVEHDYVNEAKRTVWVDAGDEPAWTPDCIYRYTPKAKEPSERALLLAHKMSHPDIERTDHQRLIYAKASAPCVALARMIEKHEPELLVEPLPALLQETLEGIGVSLTYIDAIRFAAEIRKRGPAFIAAVGEGT